MNKPRLSEWVGNALLLSGAVGVAVLMASLAMENRELKQQLADLRAAGSTLPNMLQAQDPLPDAKLLSLAGEVATLRELTARGGVVAFLTTTCPYCEQTLPIWSDLVAWSAAQGIPFVAVSLHDATATADYASDKGIEWPIWVLEDPAGLSDLNVSSVPFTLLVSESGVVEAAWLGALTDNDSEQLRNVSARVLTAAGESLSRFPAGDPNCCEAPTSGTGVDG